MDLFAMNLVDFAAKADFFPYFPVWQGKWSQRETEARCTSRGIQPGTADYVNCVQTNKPGRSFNGVHPYGL
jgi:hypothetical protein